MGLSKEKELWREEIGKAFDKSGAVFLAEYKGMTVESLSLLRRKLREVGAEYKIVKNSIAKKAIAGRSEEVIADFFKNQVGVVFAYQDYAAAAKALAEVAKTNDKLVMLGGYMEGRALSKEEVKIIASLPSREELLSKIIGSLVAPHKGLLSIIKQVGESKEEAVG